MTEASAVPSQRESTTPVERLRGMQDVGPEAYRARRQVLDRLLEVLGRHGYQLIETPVLEPTELFLRKSGAERIAQMYAVTYRNREIALRPEHTASVLRYYVESLQTEPLPLRLAYAGPVFRYERPQAGRSRQFTEVGCELLGAPGPAGDAEVIHLAAEVLDAVGIRPRIVVGHVGIVLDFLSRLPLRQRVRDWLLWSMERLRKGQPVDLEPELAGLTKEPRFAVLLEKATELGVAEIVPVVTRRSVVRPWKEGAKQERWRRIVIEATEQCERARPPRLHTPLPLPQALRLADGLRVVPWEEEQSLGLRQLLRGLTEAPRQVSVLVGPEGGLEPQEVEMARGAGFAVVTLGPRILRAETAAIVACALVMHELGELGP